ncbi:class I SAM-dependent methyltransferase [Microbacterium sulfonylureivorans]|uniref:class I SAM-dependent methyltransferase n=1 Tax=Microbacterium sulfonylureivorans TaxID=2486854 RepID=UPI0013DF5A20|nr:class I SAM-dependent methyltransferase [Microbacterium sulfonylureivorans]
MTADDDQSLTLAAYERGAERYAALTPMGRSALVDDLLGAVAPGAEVLELGSGPGRDAAALESGGVRVHRTDGSSSFVAMLREDGHTARLLDVRADDFGGPYDAIFANAVLLHVPRPALAVVLEVARRSCRPGGPLIASFKKGRGEAWSVAKLEDARHFTYWQEDDLAAVAHQVGWTAVRAFESTGVESAERWITLIARNGGPAPG